MDIVDYEVFCKCASNGIAMGMDHRYEWYTNAGRMLSYGLYSEIMEQQTKIDKAFLAFEKTLVSCPEEEDELKNLTLEGFHKRIGDFYEQAQARHRKQHQG